MTDDLYERYKEALRLGHVAVLKGALEEALEAYRLAASIAPSRALPHTSLGGVLLRLGHLEEALVEYASAVARAPHDEGALLGQAEALAAAGQIVVFGTGTGKSTLLKVLSQITQPTSGEIVADCTVGYGGHALEFLRRISPGGRLIGFDVDGPQLERTRGRLTAAGFANFDLHRMNFAGVGKVLGGMATPFVAMRPQVKADMAANLPEW